VKGEVAGSSAFEVRLAQHARRGAAGRGGTRRSAPEPRAPSPGPGGRPRAASHNACRERARSASFRDLQACKFFEDKGGKRAAVRFERGRLPHLARVQGGEGARATVDRARSRNAYVSLPRLTTWFDCAHAGTRHAHRTSCVRRAACRGCPCGGGTLNARCQHFAFFSALDDRRTTMTNVDAVDAVNINGDTVPAPLVCSSSFYYRRRPRAACSVPVHAVCML